MATASPEFEIDVRVLLGRSDAAAPKPNIRRGKLASLFSRPPSILISTLKGRPFYTLFQPTCLCEFVAEAPRMESHTNDSK